MKEPYSSVFVIINQLLVKDFHSAITIQSNVLSVLYEPQVMFPFYWLSTHQTLCEWQLESLRNRAFIVQRLTITRVIISTVFVFSRWAKCEKHPDVIVGWSRNFGQRHVLLKWLLLSDTVNRTFLTNFKVCDGSCCLNVFLYCTFVFFCKTRH